MDDLSLTIYDLSLNSIRANCKRLDIKYFEDTENEKLIITIKDDGEGIKEDVMDHLTDPFYTTRNTRNVGLGLAFLKQLTELTEGTLNIHSEEHKGTTIYSEFKLNHVDLPPLGDISETVIGLMMHQNDVDVSYQHQIGNKKIQIEKKDILHAIEGLSLQDYKIFRAVKSYIDETIHSIKGEMKL